MLHRTSTWMIATAAMVSLGHLVKPCTFIPHAPSTFPRHFGLQVGLSIQVGSLDIDLGRCRKKIWVQFVPCHESHHWPDWPGMLNMEFGTCAKFHRWSNKDLPAEARKLGSSFCARFPSGFHIFQFFHLHGCKALEHPNQYNKSLGWHMMAPTTYERREFCVKPRNFNFDPSNS